MRTYVSYVIQDENGHTHKAEVVKTGNPLYSFSADPQVVEIISWAENKKQELKPNQELVIVGMYKL
jgi:hypothetical protein